MIIKFNDKKLTITILFMLFLLSGCGPSAEEMAATKTKNAEDIFTSQTAAAPTATITPSPTATKTPIPTPNRTATAAFRATQEAQPMADLIQKLYNEGYIQSTKGEFIPISYYFEENFAQIDWVRFFSTGFNETISNFVLRSDIGWKTAKEGANLIYSGCGFSFGYESNNKSFHFIKVSLDGYLRLHRCMNDCLYFEDIAKGSIGRIDYMQGSAELIMIVENGTIHSFVNGEHVFVRHNQKEFEGYLDYAVGSGTNKGFGTRCIFRHTEIWKLE